MKARQLKNGSWNFSGVSSETIVAIAKVLKFAHEAEMHYGYNIEELRSMIDDLRNDGDTLALVGNVEFFARCLREDIEK